MLGAASVDALRLVLPAQQAVGVVFLAEAALFVAAAIMAARRAGDAIGPADLQAGWLKVAVGTGRPVRRLAIVSAAG